MSNAVEKIVDTYVQLNDHQALEDLRTYRQRLAFHLKARTGLDFSLLVDQIDASRGRNRHNSGIDFEAAAICNCGIALGRHRF